MCTTCCFFVEKTEGQFGKRRKLFLFTWDSLTLVVWGGGGNGFTSNTLGKRRETKKLNWTHPNCRKGREGREAKVGRKDYIIDGLRIAGEKRQQKNI